MRRVALLVLAFILLASPAAGADAPSGDCGDHVVWSLQEGVLTLRGEGPMYWYDMGSAPWYAFRDEIRSLAVEEGITSVCYSAFFYLSALTEASLPHSLKEIGSMAFYGCSALPYIYIPSLVSSIGQYAFYGCRSLEEIRVNDDNETYRDEEGVLFQGSTLLCYPPAKAGETYQVPAGTEQLSECAFSYCQITQLSIPAGVWHIDYSALTDCASLSAVEVAWDNWFYADQDGVLFSYDKAALICYPPKKADVTYGVPAQVTEIAIRAFSGNEALERVDILGSVRSLGSMAFRCCTNLKRAVFHGDAPDTVGFAPFSDVCTAYYLEGKNGWDAVAPADWNVADVQRWTGSASLLKNRGKLAK